MAPIIPQDFWQGVEEFNQGQFYACHDTLEALWMEAPEPPRSLYQGILQLAVACYHLGNQNWRGAVILLGEGIQRLQPYQPVYMGIDIEQLMSQSTQLLHRLQQAGPERVGEFSRLVSDRTTVIPSEATESPEPASGDREALRLPVITRVNAAS